MVDINDGFLHPKQKKRAILIHLPRVCLYICVDVYLCLHFYCLQWIRCHENVDGKLRFVNNSSNRNEYGRSSCVNNEDDWKNLANQTQLQHIDNDDD